MVPSVFSRLSFVFGKASKSCFLVLSSETVKLGRHSKPLLFELEDFADLARILVLMCFLSDNLAYEPRIQVET